MKKAFALSLGLRALRELGLSAFAPATEGALAKLGRVLPEALRESIQTVEDVVAIEPGPWVVTTSGESLIRVASAIRSRHRVRFVLSIAWTTSVPAEKSGLMQWCTWTVAGT